MSRLLFSLIVALGLSSQAFALEMTPLVDAQWLNEHLDQHRSLGRDRLVRA